MKSIILLKYYSKDEARRMEAGKLYETEFKSLDRKLQKNAAKKISLKTS